SWHSWCPRRCETDFAGRSELGPVAGNYRRDKRSRLGERALARALPGRRYLVPSGVALQPGGEVPRLLLRVRAGLDRRRSGGLCRRRAGVRAQAGEDDGQQDRGQRDDAGQREPQLAPVIEPAARGRLAGGGPVEQLRDWLAT